MTDAAKDADKQKKEDKQLLERLLREQRGAFEAELAGIRGEVAAEEEARAKAERIELLRRQVTRRMMNRGISRGFTVLILASQRVSALTKKRTL